ncbi:MAG: biotin transporter BioY [Deltaproteobacteria bacterium]|nr:biotin transporter BioY [Deltaproteobacteria bacterium]
MDSSAQLRMMVYASLLAALTAAGAYLAIPIGPVPIVLQNLFILLTGLLLGSRWGLASVGVYLLAGALGLPVFAGGLGGIGRLVGPTGGYLVGLWLQQLTGMTLSKTLMVGMYPFLIGDALKIAVAVPIAKALRPIVRP